MNDQPAIVGDEGVSVENDRPFKATVNAILKSCISAFVLRSYVEFLVIDRAFLEEFVKLEATSDNVSTMHTVLDQLSVQVCELSLVVDPI